MRITHSQAPVLFDCLNQSLSCNHNPSTSYLISLVDDQNVAVAVCALGAWGEHNVELTLATDGTKRWVARKYMQAIGDFCFADSSRSRVTAIVPSDRKEWAAQVARFGFKHEGTLEDWYGTGRPGELYCITRGTYNRLRWSRKSNVRQACSNSSST